MIVREWSNVRLEKVGESGDYDEYVFDFTGDERREYLRLLQLSPWCEADAERLAQLQPLETACYATWDALLDRQCRDPGSVSAGELAKAEERDTAWWNEWAALDSKWKKKTAEGRAAADREWRTHRPCNFSLPREGF
jgi:hypothetical protein